eukprot:3519079-Pyramimonas_sp.AAC.1
MRNPAKTILTAVLLTAAYGWVLRQYTCLASSPASEEQTRAAGHRHPKSSDVSVFRARTCAIGLRFMRRK